MATRFAEDSMNRGAENMRMQRFSADWTTNNMQSGESRDQVAVNGTRGRSDRSMGANFLYRMSDERLRDVVRVVREWLWSPENDTDDDSDNADIIQVPRNDSVVPACASMVFSGESTQETSLTGRLLVSF
ncbi:MAG: hypothetical protein IID45_14445 [Planctomycetes bacterium]|nr:hypothetical protein [Planctomycetota bacterium]